MIQQSLQEQHVASYLDTGASNHMSGSAACFNELDRRVAGTVKFGDSSVVAIRGRGSVLFTDCNGGHRVLTGVYFIPRIRNSIVSVGQLDESGCKMVIADGVFTLNDRRGQVFARASRAHNRLYPYDMQLARPVCLAVRTSTDEAWRWHARYGHMNFNSFQLLARQDMVRGLLAIDHVDQMCDSCLAGKQRRPPFPDAANYRAEHVLELVHGDL